MPKNIVLVGAGHAHLTTLKNLDLIKGKGHEITIINPYSHHYYSGMGPGMLSGAYDPEDVRFDVKKMTVDRGGRFIQDHATEIDAEKQRIRTKQGDIVEYDVVSFNTGSFVPRLDDPENNSGPDFLFPVKPIHNLLKARKKLVSLFPKKTPRVLVCGGGAAGVEIAANVRALAKKYDRDVDIVLVAGGAVLKQFDVRVREKALEMLQGSKVNILERDKVIGISDNYVHLLSGVSLHCDLAFMALGVSPSSIFKTSGLPVGGDGGLLVNECLQSVKYPNIFGGGDCIAFKPRKLPKVGVYAVRQNPFLFENLFHFLEDKPLEKFIPQREFLLILNMGNGRGLLRWKKLVLKGRTAFKMKDAIDRKFMRTFQS